jgi:hypothetical protein
MGFRVEVLKVPRGRALWPHTASTILKCNLLICLVQMNSPISPDLVIMLLYRVRYTQPGIHLDRGFHWSQR